MLFIYCYFMFYNMKYNIRYLHSLFASIPVEHSGHTTPDQVPPNPLVAVQEEPGVCVLRGPSLTPNVKRPNTLQNIENLNMEAIFSL